MAGTVEGTLHMCGVPSRFSQRHPNRHLTIRSSHLGEVRQEWRTRNRTRLLRLCPAAQTVRPSLARRLADV